MMQIHYAARHGDREAVLRQLASGIPIDAPDDYEGATPLMWAARSSKADASFLSFLIENGADVNIVAGSLHKTPLFEALQSDSLEKVRVLIESGSDVRFRNAHSYSALIMASPGSPEITRLLIEAGAEMDGVTPWGESALSRASYAAEWPVVRLLLDAGADPAPLKWTPLMQAVVFGTLAALKAFLDALDDALAQELVAIDRWERTPWLQAVCTSDIAKAHLLLDYGSDLHAHGGSGQTALMYASECDDAPMVCWLLELGADVTEATPFGDTALHEAARHGATHVIPLLLAAGADVQASNEVETQPIDEASDPETVRLLVAAGADINYVNGQGNWLLKSAAGAGNIVLARALLDMGASVHTTSTGETALHAAARDDAPDIMRLLLDAGTNLNAQDVDGWGVLWYARTTEAVQMLLDAGVDVHLTDEMGQEALANHSDTEIQRLLIGAGCYVNPPDGGTGSPLRKALRRGNLAQIRFLMDAGADVNAATGWGATPLMEAAEKSFAQGVELLLSANADAAARDDAGRTAMHHAAAPEAFTAYKLAQEMQSPEWLAKTLEHLPEELRETFEPLSLPARLYGYVESDTVDCLLRLAQAGAELDAPDAEGMTPLMLASSCGRPSHVAVLLSLGASLTVRDSQDRSAADHAAMHPREQERQAIMALLMSKRTSVIGTEPTDGA